MAQKREKEETLELKVPADSPSLSLSSYPPACPGPDPARLDPYAVDDGPRSDKKRRRTHEREEEKENPSTAEEEVVATAAEKRRSEAVVDVGVGVKKAVNRCSGCGKRVGLTGFRCRCGDLFCSTHRYSDRHECSFDYKEAGREAIRRENPVVRAPKILKV